MKENVINKYRFLPPLGEWVTSYWQCDRLIGLSLGEEPWAATKKNLTKYCGVTEIEDCPPGVQTSQMLSLEWELAEYYAGRHTAFTVPMTLYGTPFQKKIWAALLELPYGSTTSYSELAAAAGVCGDRACGSAVGANPIAVVVPCHRVVPKSGKIGSYSSGRGPATKRALLELEAGRNQGGARAWK